jgi:5-methylcytosine-specific restriction protein A
MTVEFIPGHEYVRASLHDELGGQRFGGISTPSAFPLVLIFTGEQGALYGYHDGFQDSGTFLYTGEGQVGDMRMIKGNLAIKNHQVLGKEIHLFEYIRTGSVQYIGQAYYLDDFTRDGEDRNGDLRSVIVFELAVDTPSIGVPDPEPVDYSPRKPKRWNDRLGLLRDDAYAASLKSVPSAERRAYVHYRSEIIKTYVLRRSQGFCEGCGNEAPFVTPRGIPYLEPHHIRRRADAGPDHPLWVIALCPNCHRRVHHGEDGPAYNAELAVRARSIEETLVVRTASTRALA